MVRSYPEPSARIARWASLKRLQDEGVVALGLGGPEPGHPASRLSEAFTIAKEFGLPINPHAGETAGPESIWETLDLTQARRIGHGVRCLEDPTLVEHLAKNAIALEVCLSSNIQLGIFTSIEHHPLKQLIDHGIPVILNTDDRALFSTSLTTEYLIAMQHAGITTANIAQCLCHAVDHCHLTAAAKDWLRVELQAPRSEEHRCNPNSRNRQQTAAEPPMI
jgi:aminodeoxyfutalosine deaminase